MHHPEFHHTMYFYFALERCLDMKILLEAAKMCFKPTTALLLWRSVMTLPALLLE